MSAVEPKCGDRGALFFVSLGIYIPSSLDPLFISRRASLVSPNVVDTGLWSDACLVSFYVVPTSPSAIRTRKPNQWGRKDSVLFT